MKTVVFGGNEYKVDYKAGSVFALQKELGGKALSDIFGELSTGKVDFNLWVTVLWAGLLSNDKNLTIEDTIKIVDLSRNGEFMSAMATAFKDFRESCEQLISQPNTEASKSKNSKSPV